jgi:hypothetical protein
MELKDVSEAEDILQIATSSKNTSNSAYLTFVKGEVIGMNKSSLEASVRSDIGILKNKNNSRPKIHPNIIQDLAPNDQVKVGKLDDGTWEIFEIIK